MKIFKLLVLLLFVFEMASCTTEQYSTKSNNYLKQSKTLPPIVVPPGAMAPTQKPYYPLPAEAIHVTAPQIPSLKPPGLQ